jgi:hypothetical protein
LNVLRRSTCAGVVWSLGRLRLVAVPPELLDRLITFVGVRLQQQQQQQQQEQQGMTASQLGQQAWQQPLPGHLSAAAGAAASGHDAGTAAADDRDGGRARFTLARQLSLLLSGLAGLSRQLTPQQQQQCRSWLLQVRPSACIQFFAFPSNYSRLETQHSWKPDTPLLVTGRNAYSAVTSSSSGGSNP